MQAQTQRSKILIVGSGFGGLGMAIRLKQQGIHDFKIIERAAEVGGTWRDNTYPGVACDVPSHLYSFSFIKNPNWSRVFPQGAEIQRYLIQCCDQDTVNPIIIPSTSNVDSEELRSPVNLPEVALVSERM